MNDRFEPAHGTTHDTTHDIAHGAAHGASDARSTASTYDSIYATTYASTYTPANAASDVDRFEPTPAAALTRLNQVRPREYPDSRNHLRGAVTRLSPYITHGFMTVPDVITSLRARHHLGPRHKLVFELAWREYFRHVWKHEGDGIFASLHQGPLPDDAYTPEVPADVRQARTGLAVIDMAVRTLYATGYLHNHARMWLASYLVHMRKVHWRAGTDWLYAHLLDGDLASNHLSWQWIAGTASHRPYLFNAENVLRYAPHDWQVLGSVLDQSYNALEALARDASARLPAGADQGGGHVEEPPLLHAPLLPVVRADAIDLHGRDVWLVHPWCLADPPPGRMAVALLDANFHTRWPWDERRWRFVQERMAAIAAVTVCDTTPVLVAALAHASSVNGVMDPHLAPAFADLGLDEGRWAFDGPTERCTSFSAWWMRTHLHVQRRDVPADALAASAS